MQSSIARICCICLIAFFSLAASVALLIASRSVASMVVTVAALVASVASLCASVASMFAYVAISEFLYSLFVLQNCACIGELS